MKNRLISCLLAVVILFTGVSYASAVETVALAVEAVPPIKNVIYLIPDGGGYGPYDFADMVKRAGGFDDSLYPNKTPTSAEPMTMRDYLVGSLTTATYDGKVTDSAAAGTALATGQKTLKTYIGVDPNGKPVANLVEAAQSVGKATGIIATYEWMHATPSAFSAHAMSRYDYKTLYQQIENQGIDVVLGTGYGKVSSYATIQNAIDRGYTIIENKEQLSAVRPGDRLWGNMASSMPYDIKLSSTQASLAEMTAAAITALSGDEDGFFLMVEGSKVDAGGHANDAVVSTSEYLAFDAAFRVAVEFAKSRTDTVVICAPDHDTGGMQLTADMTAEVADVQKGINPSTISWTTTDHTGQNGGVWMYVPAGVPVIPGLSPVLGDTPETRANYVIDNTAIAPYVADLFGVDLAELTDTLFTDVTDIGSYVNGKFIFNDGTKYVYANQSVYYRDGQAISMDGEVAVSVNGRFYVPEKIVEAADWTAKNENLDGFAGTGTKDNPYIIADAYDFVEFTKNVLAGSTYSGAYFRQTADIDLTDNPIYTGMGKSCTFAGTYDGNGHRIHARITTSLDECLFPYVSGTIMNLGTTGSVECTGTYAGGIARSLRSSGKLINCYSHMELTGSNVSGLVYTNYGRIVNCYFGGTLSGSTLYPIAKAQSGSSFADCYYVTTCGASQSKTGITAVDGETASSTLADSLNDGLSSALAAAGEAGDHMAAWTQQDGGMPIHAPAYSIASVSNSVSFDDLVHINQYVSINGLDPAVYTKAYIEANGGMLIWHTEPDAACAGVEDATAEHVVGLMQSIRNGVIRYGQQTGGIAPRNYGDDVFMRVYLKLVDGTYLYSDVFVYSVETYCRTALEQGSEALKPAARAMLHYGAAAQLHFNYKTDDLVSSGIEPIPFSETMLTPVAPYTTELVATDTLRISRSLSYDGNTSINFYFDPTGLDWTAQHATMQVWIDDNHLTEANCTEVDLIWTGSRWGAQTRGLSAREYEKTVYARAKFVDTDGHVHYSEIVASGVEEYAATAIEQGSDSMKVLAKMSVVYGEYVKAYLEGRA